MNKQTKDNAFLRFASRALERKNEAFGSKMPPLQIYVAHKLMSTLMNVLYNYPFQAVNKKDATFVTSLILFLVEVYSFILNNLREYMLQQSLASSFANDFNGSEKWTYSFLTSKYPTFKKVHVEKDSLLKELNLGTRQLERHLQKLENAGLLQRSYATVKMAKRKIGNVLHLTLTPKKTVAKIIPPETMEDMKFFALYVETQERHHERFGVSKYAVFRDVYNLQDTIRLKYAFCDYEDDDLNARTLNKLNEGSYVVFKGSIRKTDKGEYFLYLIRNIQPREIFYDAELRQQEYMSEIFTFVSASHLIAKANLWEERDEARKKKYEKLNNEVLAKVSYDKHARIGCKGSNKFWYGYKSI